MCQNSYSIIRWCDLIQLLGSGVRCGTENAWGHLKVIHTLSVCVCVIFHMYPLGIRRKFWTSAANCYTYPTLINLILSSFFFQCVCVSAYVVHVLVAWASACFCACYVCVWPRMCVTEHDLTGTPACLSTHTHTHSAWLLHHMYVHFSYTSKFVGSCSSSSSSERKAKKRKLRKRKRREKGRAWMDVWTNEEKKNRTVTDV